MSLARLGAIVMALAASVNLVLGVAGHSRLSGPVLVTLSRDHGIHADDLTILLCWALVMLGSVALWRRGR
ncbi:MAG: hypothetical protein QM638_04570 [Nocardioides sp.]|uniref:hypothetical protein n=1 Tax=Nocardioides sp. TaxID=35761 RepID=UPI0039E53362